jgi:hypothetical protein
LAGTAITTIGSCGKPFAFIDAEDRGYTFSIPTLTRTALSAVLVGSLGNGVVNSTPGGRFMSLLDSSSTNTDGAAPPEPSSSAGPAGQRLRQAGRCTGTNAQLVAAAIAYDTVEQISTIFHGTTSRFGATTGRPFKQPPRPPSTARASPWASRATARSARRPGPTSPSGGFSPPPSAQRIASAVCRRKGLLRPAIVAIAS